MPKIIRINDIEVGLGEHKQIDLPIGKLPTHTPIDIPIYVFRGHEDGTTLLLQAGMHGDEINGIEILRKMIYKKMIQPKRGTVIVIPILNIYGFLNFSRDVPDGKDVNRCFPGSKNGSLASRVAFNFMEHILPNIDAGIDFHTGGNRIYNYPQIRCEFSNAKNLELAHIFAARFTINSEFIEKSLRYEANKKNVPILVYEGGEALRLNQHATDEGIAGALRVMKHLNIIDEAPKIKEENLILSSHTWIRAADAGIFIALFKDGAFIQKGQEIGYITDPFGEQRLPIISPKDGYIVGTNNMPVVNAGDALLHLGFM